MVHASQSLLVIIGLLLASIVALRFCMRLFCSFDFYCAHSNALPRN